MTNQIKQHQTKWTVYFVIVQIMLKSLSKVKLVNNHSKIHLTLISYNTERFNITYAVFQLRFSETLVN